jgi:2,3-bisphosphoglycerate-dependent phosphoglycerate mutase
MYTLVLVRHGESEWNKENRFTGWTDVPLSETGKNEAMKSGELLYEKGFTFNLAYTSVLKRAIDTLNIILSATDLEWIQVIKDWRLNERHYGALQGLNKSETAQQYGDEQVHLWRRSYDILPPLLDREDPRFPGHDPRYKDVPPDRLPASESLELTVKRVTELWEDSIMPDILRGKKIIISAHGNSLRALVKYLDKMTDKDIMELNIPTGIPLVYELDAALKPLRHYYLADEEEVRKAALKVAQQGKASKE